MERIDADDRVDGCVAERQELHIEKGHLNQGSLFGSDTLPGLALPLVAFITRQDAIFQTRQHGGHAARTGGKFQNVAAG